MFLSKAKNINIARIDFITENWAFIPNGPAVNKPKLQWPMIECDITRQQNHHKLTERRFFTKCYSVCLDINEPDGFGSRSILFTHTCRPTSDLL